MNSWKFSRITNVSNDCLPNGHYSEEIFLLYHSGYSVHWKDNHWTHLFSAWLENIRLELGMKIYTISDQFTAYWVGDSSSNDRNLKRIFNKFWRKKKSPIKMNCKESPASATKLKIILRSVMLRYSVLNDNFWFLYTWARFLTIWYFTFIARFFHVRFSFI